MSATSDTETPSEIQNGENFNEEMKDYAKSTMNELLGMFGYKEEITREAVEELQIKLLPEEDEDHMQPGGDDADKLIESDGPSEKAVDIKEKTPAVVVEVEGCNSADSASVLPVSNGKDLAPHFLVHPPNIHGVYCVVANLPVVNSKGKTNMTFKFWNCIMCSEYFVEKPEVAFRVEHPHLFQSQPAWLYQAAVCRKCHQILKSALQETPTSASREESSLSSSSFSSMVVTVPRQQNMETGAVNSLLAGIKSGRCAETRSVADYKTTEHSTETGSVADYMTTEHSTETDFSVVPSQPAAKVKSEELEKSHDYLFECFVCSKPVRKSSRQGRLRRSKFPTLFNSFPENLGVARVCFICCERLTRQRDRYVRAGISEEFRDYIAHIKIWTGQDVSSKFASMGVSKTSSDSSCFICEKFIPVVPNELVKTLQRSKYPSLFSFVPDQILNLSCCDACSRKLQKVKNRFDENNTKEEERDYWEYITSWRDKKGLEKHVYSR